MPTSPPLRAPRAAPFMPLNQSQRKAASEALDEFLTERYGPDKQRMKYPNLDLLLTIFAGAGISVLSTALTFDFPAEVELPAPAAPKPALPPLPSAQQLASRLPAVGDGPRRLTNAERDQALGWYAAAWDMRHNSGFSFKAATVLDIVRLLRKVSGETAAAKQ